MIRTFTIATLLLFAPDSSEVQSMGGQGPLDFRCDSGKISSKPNRTLCKDNVVVRRGNLLLCCEVMHGYADEDWNWQRLVCIDNVRAQRADEIVWSRRAEYFMQSADLVLTGEPELKRGKSLVRGSRVVIEVDRDRARVEQPRGRFENTRSSSTPPAPPAWLHAEELPAQCPLPKAAPSK